MPTLMKHRLDPELKVILGSLSLSLSLYIYIYTKFWASLEIKN